MSIILKTALWRQNVLGSISGFDTNLMNLSTFLKKYFSSLSSPSCKMVRIIFNKIMVVKHLALCLADSKHSVNVIINIHMI